MKFSLQQMASVEAEILKQVRAHPGISRVELARKLQNTIEKLSLIADRLEAGQGSAGKLLKDPSVYNNTDQMLVETRNLVKAIRENPKKYLTIHFRVF